MNTSNHWRATCVRHAGALLLALSLTTPHALRADGTETLGTPSIAIASGTAIAARGVGLELGQPGLINLAIPAGATIKQVLLYWEGQSFVTDAPDDTLEVNGIPVTGGVIGGPTTIFGKENPPGSGIFVNVYTATLRADITALGVVGAGANVLSIGGMNFSDANNGAGVVVIYDSGSGSSDIQLLDGNDFAFKPFQPDPKGSTVPQTFTFAPVKAPTTATLTMFFSSVQGTASGLGSPRPNAMRVKVGPAVYQLETPPPLNSNDGEEWDTLILEIDLLPGDSSITVEAISGPSMANPASFSWNVAALTVPILPAPECVSPLKYSDWKKGADRGRWLPTGYQPGQTLGSVFSAAPAGVASVTLLDAIKGKAEIKPGGKESKDMFKHGVAALLNAADPFITYPLTTPEVIQQINAALQSNDKKKFKDLKKVYEKANKEKCPKGKTSKNSNCTTDGRPNKLTLEYSAGSCADSSNEQPSGKFACAEFNGGLLGDRPARIIVSSDSKVPTATSARFFDGLVNPDDSFDVLGSFGANTYVFIYEDGVLKQSVQFHTSCSAPLVDGDSFGGITLLDYAIVP